MLWWAIEHRSALSLAQILWHIVRDSSVLVTDDNVSQGPINSNDWQKLKAVWVSDLAHKNSTSFLKNLSLIAWLHSAQFLLPVSRSETQDNIYTFGRRCIQTRILVLTASTERENENDGKTCYSKAFFRIPSFVFCRRDSYRFGMTWGWIHYYIFWVNYIFKCRCTCH